MAIHWFASRFGVSARWMKALGTVAIALPLALAGCDSPEYPSTQALGEADPGAISAPSAPAPGLNSGSNPGSNPGATSQVIGEPIISEHELTPGRHCYAVETDRLTAAIGVMVTGDGRVMGEGSGSYAEDSGRLFKGHTHAFSGSIEQGRLTLDLTTYVQEDRAAKPVLWVLANDQLDTGENVYDQVDCSLVEEQLEEAKQVLSAMSTSTTSSPYEPGAGLASARLANASAAPNELTEAANFVRVRRLSFAPGLSNAVVEDAVVRADRDEYLVGATAGQTMTLALSAVEQNAVFGVVAPDGAVLLDGETFVELKLPQSGDYSIVVGGTRGNASYGLEIEIR